MLFLNRSDLLLDIFFNEEEGIHFLPCNILHVNEHFLLDVLTEPRAHKINTDYMTGPENASFL
jgi:hypothetical protein